jgi:hypothetical protein
MKKNFLHLWSPVINFVLPFGQNHHKTKYDDWKGASIYTVPRVRGKTGPISAPGAVPWQFPYRKNTGRKQQSLACTMKNRATGA